MSERSSVSRVQRWYEPSVPEGYEWVRAVDPSDYDLFGQFGASCAEAWKPVRVSFWRTEGPNGGPRLHADMPWFAGNAIVLRPRARAILGSLCALAGELLPLACDDDQLCVWNVTNVVDAIDLDRSEVVRFPSTGRVMRVKKHVFRHEKLVDIVAFRTPDTRAIYVNEEFADTARAASLTGVEFREVGAVN